MLSSFSKLLPLTVLSLMMGAGCVAGVQTRPAYAVYAGYESYPHTVYHGRTVYYFDGGWHYRHARRWVYVDEEPDLYQYRTRSRHVRNAPDAEPDHPAWEHSHRYDEHRRSAPPAD